MSAGMYELKISEESIERANNLLKSINGGFEKAMSSAVKKAARAGKAKAKPAVVKQYAISQGQFLQYSYTVDKTKVGGGNVAISFGYKGTVIKLMEFNTYFSKEGGARANVKRANSPKRIPRAFVATMSSSGYTGLFRRRGPSRYPIDKLYGPAVPQMIYANDAVLKELDKVINDTWEDTLDSEINRVLNGYGG